MFCEKCGNTVSQGALFCTNCGAPIVDHRDNDTSVDTDLDSLDLNIAGDSVERKKIRLKPLLWISSGVLIAGVLLAGLLIPGFRYFMERTFLPAKMLMVKAYSSSVEGVFESHLPISEIAGDMAAEYEAQLTVSESSLSMLSMFMGANAEDILALTDITVTCDANRQGNLLKASYDLALRDTSVLTAEQYVDQSNGDLWLLLPQLNSQPLYVALPDSIDPSQKLDQNVLAAMQADPDVLQEIAIRYMEMLLDGFESIEKNTKAVKLNGLTERMTVLEAYTNEVELHNTLLNILETMQTDEDILSILDSSTNPNAAAQFKADVQQLMDQMKDSSVELNADHAYTLYTYLNNRNRIAGARLEYGSDEGIHDIFSCLKVSMGDDYAEEYTLFEDIVINGKGTIGEKITGNYKVFVSGTEMCRLELTDWEAAAEGLSGTLRLIPDEQMINAMLAQANMDPGFEMFSGMLDISLMINLNHQQDQAALNASLQVGSSDVIGVSLRSKQKEVQNIQLPAEYANAMDESGVTQWMSGVDVKAIQDLMNRLEQAGFSFALLPDMCGIVSDALMPAAATPIE